MKKMNSYKNVQQSVCLDSRTVHSKITILIIHDESCTMDHLFTEMIFSHYRQRRSPGIRSSSAVFSPNSHEQHPSFPTCDLTLIYNLSCSFCILGFGEVSQFNYLKMLWICMFICTAQNDLLLFVQCF